MTKLQPISALANYNQLLNQVQPDNPIFLTQNGRKKYALMDISELEKLQSMNHLYQDIIHAESGSTTALNDFRM
ncbi:type II toxin-antitoxin system prevent-host-death family antitoxin [Lacticaseibacillus sharpeae]|uniref:type II toxin-antitoxin system prevent-host-death family antitoxin n=1 Tax=Lacticaseibacillus sharpeae TaxID=1626 RepID=UPI0006D15A0D|nr:type II toxin-antitoxin system prevent-host-death family antitoxin [Lacticaseibacillus sharpeae]